MGEITFRSDILINGRGGSRCVDARRYRGWEPGRGGTLRLPASSEACRFLSTDDIVSVWSGAVLCVRPPRKAPEGNGSTRGLSGKSETNFRASETLRHRHRHGSQEGGDPGGAAPRLESEKRVRERKEAGLTPDIRDVSPVADTDSKGGWRDFQGSPKKGE